MKYSILCMFLIFLLVECVNRTKPEKVKLKNRIRAGRRNSGRAEAFENLFQLYDPTFLSVVWPRISNGVHVLIELSCWDDLTVFFKDLSAGRAWAYRAVDASGRYPSGMFSGNNIWLGSNAECLQLDHEFTSRENNETLEELSNSEYVNAILRKEKYFDDDVHNWRWMVHRDELTRRIVAADNRPPYRMAYWTVKITLNITKITMAKSYDIILGVCLPKSCPIDDVESIVNFGIMINDNLKSNSLPRLIKVGSVKEVDEFNMATDIGAIFLLSVIILLVILAISAAGVEMDLIKCKTYHTKSMSFDLEKFDDDKVTNKDKIVNNDLKYVEDVDRNKGLVITKIKSVPEDLNDKVNCMRCGKHKKQCGDLKHNKNSCNKSKYSFESMSTDDENESVFVRLYLCFSVIYCWERIFNKTIANQNLCLIHGLRILATFWIIFVHVSAMVYYMSGKTTDINEHDDVYYTLVTGTIAFDILFFVSGLFSSHHFFYMKSRYSVEELVNFGGSCGQILQFVCFVTNRIIRLLPSYLFVILFSAVTSRVSRNNAPLVLPDGDHQNCGIYWWRNVLYITNLYPDDEKCMQVSWYLSTETQLHALGALACTISVSGSIRARFVGALAMIGILASTAVDVSTAFTDFGNSFSDVFNAYSSIIERPLSRLAPYIIGVFVGWLVHVLNGKLRVTKVTGSLLWIFSLTLLLVSCMLPYVADAWLTAWVHLAWPVALMWPVLICTASYASFFRHILGSSNIAALSRLCYSMLLLHTAVARGLVLSADVPLCSHNVCIWIYFISTSVVTVLAALLLSLLVEMPCCSLLRRLSDCATS
ncbi:hypothetical protein K1T71_002945 [Dendrolimus kikuchii]|uniref:Uncharacterized protein n=1 Tax=Dendrolimus kikuchii TaxID=765133 RepID=A0ACC1DAK3_9NEOP|nr:hypothetical protein K1T71_002945 [Dendrolimus kikuchii]